MTVIKNWFKLFRFVREETGSSVYEIKEFFRLGKGKELISRGGSPRGLVDWVD